MRVVLSFGGTLVSVRPSSMVAVFSSQGPNVVMPEILKPNLIGPDVNILVGWSSSVSPTGLAKDNWRTQFNIMYGENNTLSICLMITYSNNSLLLPNDENVQLC